MSDTVDLTRYVRTPAGERYFHRPIGSPIGGGGVAKKAAKSAVKRSMAKRAVATAKADVNGTQAARVFHKGMAELPLEERRKAVQQLRQALRGKKGALDGVDTHALVKVAADFRQDPHVRMQAKKELSRRVLDIQKANALHRKAAMIAMQNGEDPHAFLGIEGKPTTEFEKALIKLSPKYGNAFLKVADKVKGTSAFQKWTAGRHKAQEKAKDHLQETKHAAIHGTINKVVYAGLTVVAAHVAATLGWTGPQDFLGHEAEPIKQLFDYMKESALL